MNTTFGSGNWDDLRFETVNPATLFSAGYKVVFLEGSDFDATELESFLNANVTAMQNWVGAGGRLLLNAAPNYDNGMSFGFGVTLNYPVFANAVAAANAAHPIFTTPLAAGTAFTGGAFSHATVTGAGLTTLIVGTGSDAGKVALAEMNYGAGKALFGGMTLAFFHSPKPQAYYLRSNILAYLRDVVGLGSAPTVAVNGGGGPAVFSGAGSLATARSSHTASVLANGQVLVTGGYGSGGRLSSAELYDPASNTWTAAKSLATARYLHTASVLAVPAAGPGEGARRMATGLPGLQLPAPLEAQNRGWPRPGAVTAPLTASLALTEKLTTAPAAEVAAAVRFPGVVHRHGAGLHLRPGERLG